MRNIIKSLTKNFNLSLMFCCFIALTQTVFAQNESVRGKVSDANGAAVSGAEVVLQRRDLRFERVFVTQNDGKFEFSGLADGVYTLTVKAANFGSSVKTINTKDGGEIELKLSTGTISEQVLVNSSSLAGTAESLDVLPGSIDKVEPQVLENSRVLNFSEALRKLPGVNVRDEEGFGLRPNIGIRGTNPTRSTKVLLLEDGIPLSYAPYGDNASYYHPPVERYESIEVLKGAGQISYGPVTVAGVVNYLTPNPPEKTSFSLKLTGGNRGYFNGAGTFGGTYGGTGILLNYSYKRGDGARENINSRLNDFSGKITRSLNSRNFLSGKFSFYKEDSNVTYTGATEAEYALNPRGNIFQNDFFFGKRFGASLSHSFLISSKAALTTNVYGAYFDRDWWRQSSNSGQRPNRLNVDPDCLSLAQLNTTCGNEGRLRTYKLLGFEPRFTYNYDAGDSFRGELQTGFRVHWEEQDREQRNGDLPNSRDGVLSERNYRQNTAYSGFIQNRFIFGRLAVTPGVRIERVNYYRQNNLQTPTFAGAFGRTEFTQVIPGIGVAVNAFKNTTIFGGVHRGFAPPRTEDIISNTGGVIDLDSELSWNYEFGIRTRPFRGVGLDATFFRLDYENQIVPASLAGGVGSVFTNGGQTLHQGFEFNARIDTGTIFNSSNNVYFSTAYTYLPTAEFRGTRLSSVSGFSTVSVSGRRLPYAPENLLTASVGYANPIGFDGFLETVYVSNQFSDDLNTATAIANSNGQRGPIASYTIFNATANYKVEKWRTTFFVTAKNLTDKVYIVDRARGILPGPPRSVQAGIKLNF
ncbi:MAG: TonB-dependent receptor plug domain-containing protein [Blastocatellia bacterium]|nr:TonB-dependent receptor plug domain-containing protein [Blastocatellia bacterium]